MPDFIYRTKLIAVAQFNTIDNNFLVENIGELCNHRARFPDQDRDFSGRKFLPDGLQSGQRENHIAHLPEMYNKNILRVEIHFFQFLTSFVRQPKPCGKKSSNCSKFSTNLSADSTAFSLKVSIDGRSLP